MPAVLMESRPPAPPLMQPRAPRNIAGLSVHLCAECLRPFAQKRCDQKFCDNPCRRAFNARVEARKTEAYHAGMAMRSKEKGAFSRLTNLFDRWIAEDRRRDEAYRAACAAASLKA